MTSFRYAAFSPDDDTPVFVISVAAELAGMHAQTLRQYDRLGLVTPSRTRGGGRRYSQRDVALLREVQRLSQESVGEPRRRQPVTRTRRLGYSLDRSLAWIIDDGERGMGSAIGLRKNWQAVDDVEEAPGK